MPQYHIYRLKEARRARFRTAPHAAGEAVVAPDHYEPFGSAEAASPYALWTRLKDSEQPLMVGDVLESAGGELRIFKYVGFEAARWEAPAEAEASGEPAGLVQTA